MAGHPDRGPLAKVCHGEALPWRTLQEQVEIKVPTGSNFGAEEANVSRSPKGPP